MPYPDSKEHAESVIKDIEEDFRQYDEKYGGAK